MPLILDGPVSFGLPFVIALSHFSAFLLVKTVRGAQAFSESEFSIKVVERSDRFQKKERVDKMVSVQYYEVMSRRVMAYRVIARRAVVSETQRLEQVFMCESAPAVRPICINFRACDVSKVIHDVF